MPKAESAKNASPHSYAIPARSRTAGAVCRAVAVSMEEPCNIAALVRGQADDIEPSARHRAPISLRHHTVAHADITAMLHARIA